MNTIKSLLRERLRSWFPLWMNAISLWRIVRSGYGYKNSVQKQQSVDGRGDEIPWFTYPAIEYLRQLDLSTKSVFEFGSGNSTIYWSKNAAHVISVEHNPEWYGRVLPRLASNCQLHLVKDIDQYPKFLSTLDQDFDVIIVDGMERRLCCIEAVKKLRPGGMVILDNADWHSGGAAVLRAAGLLEVDMTGFGPIAWFTTTTSFFFHRQFAFLARHNRQPMHGIGSLPHEVS